MNMDTAMGNTETNHSILKQLVLDWGANKGDKTTRTPIFAKLIREAVSAPGWHHRELADDLEVSISTLSGWADGRVSPHRLVQARAVEHIDAALERAEGKP